MNSIKIPETDSIQELAHFLNTHDLTDFEDQLEEVSHAVFERNTVKLHLQSGEAEIIRKLARSKGISHSDLIREWVLEGIHAM